jgi:hypothetical protein
MSGGALPTVQGPAGATLTSVQPTRLSVSHSLKRQARTSGAQRWAIAINWSPMRRSVFMQFYAFLIGQRGQADTFTCTLAGHTAPQGLWTGTPVVSGASQTGRSVTLSGFPGSQTGIAKAGDLIKFAGHTKVYMVTADANSNVSGIAALSIEPALLQSPANAEAVVSSNVPFTVALAADNLDMALSPGLLTPLAISVVEVY